MTTKTAFATAGLAALLLSGTALAGGYPDLAPLPPVSSPADNPTTPEKVELGRKLFWDGRLSGNGSMACVACHRPDLGWGTGGAISLGYPGTQHWRKSQTILNSAYYNKLFWDGASTSLENQASAAAAGAIAGNGDDAMMEMRLRVVPEYVTAFKQVFGTEWPNIDDAWKAIAAFQRTIVTDAAKVPFDRFTKGDATAISDDAKRGLDLFKGKAGCISCHNGTLLSDQKFYDTGVPDNPVFQSDPVFQITLRWQHYQKGVSEQYYRTGTTDDGLYYVTLNPQDKGKFRTPSLREIGWTGPYMHNGVFDTLEQVVDFYDKGGGEARSGTKVLKPLGLSEQERKDLLAFLGTLSMEQQLLMADPALPESKPLPRPGAASNQSPAVTPASSHQHPLHPMPVTAPAQKKD
ncbi:MAG TPA: cytochrome c peroxidase [Azospirillaceae bacterium]|nr:cytochrome c peroxidase [Azospirillaceae bacterium]